MERQTYKHVIARLVICLLLSLLPLGSLQAWYAPPYGYPQAYSNAPGYWQGYPGYWPGGHGTYWHGSAGPRWYMRGRMNRYGDYRIDVRVRDVSMRDMYLMWLLYNGY